jgi:DNA-binding response OmpR family regulator/predicted regulator of Ras-like GTPase activity (Roadblock/LC7/MglB family)
MGLPNILVVDPDEGFGTMLQEGLSSSGYYTVKWVDNGMDAVKAIRTEHFDLAIIDISITDMSAYKLVLGMRHFKKDIRIMLIPFFGEELADKLKGLNPDGTLSKPFFVGDLPDVIDQALGRPPGSRVSAAPPPPPEPEPEPPTKKESSTKTTTTPPAHETLTSALTTATTTTTTTKIIAVPKETIRYLRSNEKEVLRILDDLNREVRAEAILLIAGLELISQAGMLSRDHCQGLTQLVAQSSQAAAEAAKFLGEPEGRFQQSLHEGSEYRLYSLSLGEGILLSLALSSNVPLGMIRHQCRQAAEHLSQFIIS